MDDLVIRIAGKDDVSRLNAALSRLSAEIGDEHHASDAELERAGFGASPAFRALIAESAGAIIGLAVYSPVFSTVRACAGVYISDLWVHDAARGLQLGRRLVLQAAADGKDVWNANYVKLVVYQDNEGARRFYERLGFTNDPEEILLTLDGRGLDTLRANN